MASNDYYGGQGGYGGGNNYGQSTYGGGQGGYGRPPPPEVPYPWRAEWDERDGRYIFVNAQNGERTFEMPRSGGGYGQQQHGGGPGYDGGYGGGQYGGPSGPGGYERPGPQYQQQQGGSGYPMGPQGGQHQEEEHKKKSGPGWMGVALGAAAGLAGGAFLMHEGHEAKEDFERDEDRVEDRYEEDKYRAEDRIDRFGQDVEDAPQNVAGWAGRKVGEMEEFPDRVENKFDDAVDDVEDAPQRMANWMGDKVGDVEGYGDSIKDSYDQGRDDGRDYEEDRYDDDRY